MIQHRGPTATTLRGGRAAQFLAEAEDNDPQEVMARWTAKLPPRQRADRQTPRAQRPALTRESEASMHRSRLYCLFVDAPIQEAPTAVTFWAAALGATPRPPEPGDPFTVLPGAAGAGIAFEVQAVDDAPRYHVDIETDDVAAEVARLTGLGATEEARHEGWVVLRAPGGHLLCVVPVQSDRALFTAHASTWDVRK